MPEDLRTRCLGAPGAIKFARQAFTPVQFGTSGLPGHLKSAHRSAKRCLKPKRGLVGDPGGWAVGGSHIFLQAHPWFTWVPEYSLHAGMPGVCLNDKGTGGIGQKQHPQSHSKGSKGKGLRVRRPQG